MFQIDKLFLIIAIIWLAFFLLLWAGHFLFHKGKSFFPMPSLDIVSKQSLSWRRILYFFIPWISCFALILLLIALIRPRSSSEIVQLQKEGIAIQVLVDRSSSMRQQMNYKGKKLSRLDTVKEVFRDFVLGDKKNLEGRKNDLIGLSTFAGFLEENVPLTLDHYTLVNFLQGIKLAQRYEDGTFIGDAVYQAVLRLVAVDKFVENYEKNYKIKSKIIVLLTDGKHTAGSFPPEEAANFAAKNNIKIYTIAITGRESLNNIGTLLFPILDTTVLKKMAQVTGGRFSEATSGESLKEIYEKINQLEKSKISDATIIYKELFPSFLELALYLILISLFLKYFLVKKFP